MSICIIVLVWISTELVGLYYPSESFITTTFCMTAHSLPFSTLSQPPHISPLPHLHHHHHHHDRLQAPNLRDWAIYTSIDEMLHCPTSPCNPHDHKSACMACGRLWALYMKITLTNNALQPVLHQTWRSMSGYWIGDGGPMYVCVDLQEIRVQNSVRCGAIHCDRQRFTLHESHMKIFFWLNNNYYWSIKQPKKSIMWALLACSLSLMSETTKDNKNGKSKKVFICK